MGVSRSVSSKGSTHHKPARAGIWGQNWVGNLFCKTPYNCTTSAAKKHPTETTWYFPRVPVTTRKTGFTSCKKWPSTGGEPAVALDTRTPPHFIPTRTPLPLRKGQPDSPSGGLRSHQVTFASGRPAWLLR